MIMIMIMIMDIAIGARWWRQLFVEMVSLCEELAMTFKQSLNQIHVNWMKAGSIVFTYYVWVKELL